MQVEDFGLRLPLALLDVSELLGGVNVDEVALLAIAKSIGLEDRIEGFLDRHVVEIRRHSAAHVFAGDDVLLRLQREHPQHFDEVGLVHVNLDGARIRHVHLRRRRTGALSGLCVAALGVLVRLGNGSGGLLQEADLLTRILSRVCLTRQQRPNRINGRCGPKQKTRCLFPLAHRLLLKRPADERPLSV